MKQETKSFDNTNDSLKIIIIVEKKYESKEK